MNAVQEAKPILDAQSSLGGEHDPFEAPSGCCGPGVSLVGMGRQCEGDAGKVADADRLDDAGMIEVARDIRRIVAEMKQVLENKQIHGQRLRETLDTGRDSLAKEMRDWARVIEREEDPWRFDRGALVPVKLLVDQNEAAWLAADDIGLSGCDQRYQELVDEMDKRFDTLLLARPTTPKGAMIQLVAVIYAQDWSFGGEWAYAMRSIGEVLDRDGGERIVDLFGETYFTEARYVVGSRDLACS